MPIHEHCGVDTGGLPAAFTTAVSPLIMLPNSLPMQAELHQWRPTMRFCRYRDLARSIWGALLQCSRQLSHPPPSHCELLCHPADAGSSCLMPHRFCAGPKGFYAIFVLQQLASISNNVAAQVECSLVIKVSRLVMPTTACTAAPAPSP